MSDEQFIAIETPKGAFRVWTRRVGEHPTKKLLLLHGGPGASHEGFEIFEQYLPPDGIEFYYYDQLGSWRSDRPDEPELWTVARFVDEVEQVRSALGLDDNNFYLLGQSWGGLLAMEYALAHQEHLKGLVVSNMMSSAPAYGAYAENVLLPSMDAGVVEELRALEAAEDYANPRYEALLMEHHYVHHVLRRPLDQWPGAVRRLIEHINQDIYVPMQGPSELGVRGTLAGWDRSLDLGRITVPTLVIGAAHDTMDPAHMAWMAGQLPNGRSLICPNGSHLAQWDDPDHYFAGLIRFIDDVDNGTAVPEPQPSRRLHSD
jgi:proline iminopeptidase